MVRVFYEPPPYGVATDLNRSPYGVNGGGLFRKFIERMSKMPQGIALGVPTVLIVGLCYLPLSKSRACV